MRGVDSRTRSLRELVAQQADELGVSLTREDIEDIAQDAIIDALEFDPTCGEDLSHMYALAAVAVRFKIHHHLRKDARFVRLEND